MYVYNPKKEIVNSTLNNSYIKKELKTTVNYIPTMEQLNIPTSIIA